MMSSIVIQLYAGEGTPNVDWALSGMMGSVVIQLYAGECTPNVD